MSSVVKNVSCFVLGTLFGSVGFKALATKKAKTIFTHVAAAGLRAKDSVMKTVSKIQENVDDIMTDAKAMNEERYAKEEAENTEEEIINLDEETQEEN